jgi:peptidoglycan hydrolase-like protein with peptidoglycan-binding domain
MYTMKESVAVAKEADAKKRVLATKSDNSIHRVQNEPGRQIGSLRGVIDNIRRYGGTPSVESIAAELSSTSSAQRAPALLALQQTHGNRYVQRVVSGIQAKLVVGQPGDKYEQEADRVADEMMRMPEPEVQRQLEEEEEELLQTKPLAGWITHLVQRQGEEEEEEEIFRTKEVPGQIPEVTPDLESRITTMRSSGKPLPESIRTFFEPRFGYDFSQVRVHTDAEADRRNRALSARAFTWGQDIFFQHGAYNPGSSSGLGLLTHELAHVVQQSGGLGGPRPVQWMVQRTIGDGHDLSAPWLAGDAVLEAIYDDERLMRNGSRGTAVKKVQQLLFYLGIDFPAHGADGIFGAETEAAVKEFQRANVDEAGTQLVDDSIVGPLTMGALNREANRTGTHIGDLIRTAPIPALQGPPTATPMPLSVDRIDVVDSAAGAIGGYPAIVGGADLNAPGPFSNPATGETKNSHQIHFHLDNGNSASLTPRRELQRTAIIGGISHENPPAEVLPPGVVGPPMPGGFTGRRVGPDGPGGHEIQRPNANTIVVADAPGINRAPTAADYPISYMSHFFLTVEDGRRAPIARIKYDVRIRRTSLANIPNAENQIVATEKKDFVRGRDL